VAGEPTWLTETRASYDRVADDYARLLEGELATKPVDRAVLALFADLVRAAGDKPVADVGCGPGRITAHLASLGVSVSGIDLSPAMVAVARRSHPSLRFDVGTLTALDRADATLAGVVAWYSVIHTPTEELPDVFAEFFRVLRPGGELLLAFQVGDEPAHLDAAYGHPVSLVSHRRRPDVVTDLLQDAGFTVHTRVLRDPERWETVPQAYLLARRPNEPGSG
jgi:SAM-dependent methyltransferase